MEVSNRTLLKVHTALQEMRTAKSKGGLFGFKYAFILEQVSPFINPLVVAMNELLERHMKRDENNRPMRVPGSDRFFLTDDAAYGKELDELLNANVAIAIWPPEKFTLEDITKGEVELPLSAYVGLDCLLEPHKRS